MYVCKYVCIYVLCMYYVCMYVLCMCVLCIMCTYVCIIYVCTMYVLCMCVLCIMYVRMYVLRNVCTYVCMYVCKKEHLCVYKAGVFISLQLLNIFTILLKGGLIDPHIFALLSI
jgi:hypothetical protein